MASQHFKKLDEEGRALAERWDQIARVTAVVALVAVVVWAACAGLRAAVHAVGEWVLGEAEHGGLRGGTILLVALLVGAIARTFLYRWRSFGDASGDGMQVALENYQITYVYDGDDPTPRYVRPAFGLALRKMLTTFLTLGSGASGGIEAPSVLIAESISAGISRVLGIKSEHELRTYQLAGIAAGVATLLGAPFTAALFATEVAYGDRIIYRKLVYGLWAGVIAFWLDTWTHGTYEPLFHAPAHEPLYSVAEYVGAALVAVAVSVPLALGFGRGILELRKIVERAGPPWLGSLAVVLAGLLAIALRETIGLEPHHVLGMGEETIDRILVGDAAFGTIEVLALVLVAKALATGLTITSGGSAGLLVPSMVLGGVAGAMTAHGVTATGIAQLDPALFAVVGIATSLVAVVGVPLAAIALVFEVFGRVFGPPAILACGLTYLVTLKFKVYEAQRVHEDGDTEVPPPRVDPVPSSSEPAVDPRVKPSQT